MHDATKVLLGTGQSSAKELETFDEDPATFLAGLACRLASTGALSLTKADGPLIGISFGKSLSNHKKTSLCRTGLRVPVLVERQPARGIVTITSYANLVATSGDTLAVGATTFTAQSGAVTPGQTTFQAATGNNETAASLAAQINAHATAGALVHATASGAVVTLTAISNSTAADTIGLVYTDTHSEIGLTVSGATLTDSDDTPDFLIKGSKVYFSDTTGKADDSKSNATISDAIYASGLLTGINESGVEVLCALVDFPGGL